MSEVNFEQARYNLIEQQIRPWDVLDQGILEAIYNTPREEFVPNSYRNLALADIAIPLAHDQVMMLPKFEARLLQSVRLTAHDRVLEVGTGSGYLTALLAKLVKQVDSVDIFADFIQVAQTRLEKLQLSNVNLAVGDASKGWNATENYDVIILTGSVPQVSAQFKRQLTEQGRLFAVVGEGPLMEAQVITHTKIEDWHTQVLFETWLPPLLQGTPSPRTFIF